MKLLYGAQGNLYKGALHLHTTRTDGRKTPEEVAALYRAEGCDFLAFTDHWVYGEDGRAGDMLLLSGCEYNIGDVVNSPVHHIVALGCERPPHFATYDEQRPPADIIREIKAAGGLAVLAHPAWSMADPACIDGMPGLDAVEIYNTVSGIPNNTRPDSSFYVDIWAARGLCPPVLATDDFHGIHPNDGPCSYTYFHAGELTRESVLAAVATGQCFASQGPVLGEVRLEDGVLHATFSMAARAVFHTQTPGGDGKVFEGPLCSAQYQVKPADRFVRLELTDAQGRRAWSKAWAL